MEKFKIVTYPHQDVPAIDLSAFAETEAKKAHDFHASFDVYAETPLTSLPGLAKVLGVASVRVKDESYRFGLNAFKVLGGSYALGRYIAKKLGEDIADLPASRILSDEVRAKLGDVTFVTATESTHGKQAFFAVAERMYPGPAPLGVAFLTYRSPVYILSFRKSIVIGFNLVLIRPVNIQIPPVVFVGIVPFPESEPDIAVIVHIEPE